MNFANLPLELQNEIKATTTLAKARTMYNNLTEEYAHLDECWHYGEYTCEQSFCDHMEKVREDRKYWFDLMVELDPELYYER